MSPMTLSWRANRVCRPPGHSLALTEGPHYRPPQTLIRGNHVQGLHPRPRDAHAQRFARRGSLSRLRRLADRARARAAWFRSGRRAESPTLSHEEHHRVVEICIETANKRVPVIAGAGSNNTREAIELARPRREGGGGCGARRHALLQQAQPAGASMQHFRAVADAIEHPAHHLQHPAALGDRHERRDDGAALQGLQEHRRREGRDRQPRCASACSGMAMGPDFNQLSGEDGTALAFMAHGGHGCISVTANVAPKLCAEFQAACLAGDFALALHYQDRLTPLHQALFLEPSPAPTKYALSRLGQDARGRPLADRHGRRRRRGPRSIRPCAMPGC